MSNQTPLYSALVQHHRLGRSAFHTPGHSGKPISQLNHLLQLDVTELPDTDSLFEAEHAILQAERHAAQVFGTALIFCRRLHFMYSGNAASCFG